MRNCTSCAVTVALSVTVARAPPNYEDKTDSSRPVRLVLDSEEVRRLILQQDAFAPKERKEIELYFRDIIPLGQVMDREKTTEAFRRWDELEKNGAHYIPERVAFLDALTRAPTVLVAPNSYCRVLQRSRAICASTPWLNPSFVKVRITTGPCRGQGGGGCEGDDITRAWPMP
jgi:hypothetical protein